jgi:TolB-like protein/Flp pilus assembly protein TadD
MPAPTIQPVFLSYAREDTDAARRIADALRSHGIEVWFDQSELRGGDAWDQKLRRQIKECALFVPIISAHTQQRREGYFRLEWKLAVERTHLMAEGVPFITPVAVDDTPEFAAIVPAEFMRVQWTRLPGALVTPQFIEQIKRLLAPSVAPVVASREDKTTSETDARSPRIGRPAAAPAPQPGAPKSRFPIVLVAGLAIAVLGLGAMVVLRPAAKETPASAAPAKPVATAEPTSTPPPAAAPAVTSKSIAVLPLANMSEDKDTGFFADGVHEDLLTNLALVPELKVVSRTSVLQYRGTTKTMRKIGEELGVAYVLEGSVRRAGNKVRVTGQLINTRTDEHVWARSYDRDLIDIFAIQSALSQEIAGALSAAISPQTQKFLERRPTENPVAYDFYLRGRDVRNRSLSGIPAPLREAETFFKSAVQQDPKFAAAWGELAGVHALFVFWGIDATDARLAQADAAIAEAARLAPEAPDVIRSIGTYAYYAHRDYVRASQHYAKLAQLQPNDPTVFSSLGLIQRRQGRWVESLGNLRRAVELDPANVGYIRNLLASLQRGRRWDEARAAHQRLIALLPGQLSERFNLADDEFAATGSMQAADELLAQLTPAERDSPLGVYWRKIWALNRGDYGEFKRLDQRQPAFEDVEDAAVSALIAGGAYLAHGDAALIPARLAESMAKYRAQAEREPANARAWGLLGTFEALLGRKEQALALIRKAAEIRSEANDALDGPIYRFYLAWGYAVTDDKDRAIEELTHVLRGPAVFSVAQLRVMSAFSKLHGDPRFEALMNDPKHRAPLF